MPNKAFYITTPIYYVNDVPHVGNASTTIAADVVARLKRLQGFDVLYATGTDENAIKVHEIAQAQGMSTQDYVDGIVPRWIDVWKAMHMTYDVFIRTTEERHKKVVEHVFRVLMEKGDIYKDVYKGWYCVSDETFFRESEVVDGLCPNPECKKPVRWVEEENYFFRLSAYADRLLEYFEANPDVLGPDFRRNEVLSFIKAGLKDACITRQAYGWGIPVPDDPDKVIYVWFDALLNYLTVAGYLQDDEKFARTWPADVQLMGKDIFVRFHSTFWPAMLMGLGLDVPRKLFGHGFWTIEGEKISKSKGNAISPIKLAEEIAEKSGASVDIAMDAIRYFVMREATFGLDADFSVTALTNRFNADLANDLGNLLNRTLMLLHRYRGGVIPTPGIEDREGRVLTGLIESEADDVITHIDKLQFSEALGAIWTVIGRGNKYMETEAPWKLAKDESCAARLDTVLYTVLDTVRSVAIMVQPFMPYVSQAIWDQLGIDEPLSEQTWDDARVTGKLKPGTQTAEPKPIFPRIDMKAADGRPQTAAGPEPAVSGPQSAVSKEKKVEEQVQQPVEEKKYLTFDEFKKMELRVATVISAEKVEGADKLLKLQVDLGTEQRQVIAGMALWYSPEDMVGRQVVMIANLQHAKIRGVESQGMLLAADTDGAAVLLKPDKEVPPGSTVR